MQNLSPSTGFDTLTQPQKLEIFKYALDNTTGEDLAKILWHRSETSEAWLQRRASYTRSLAVMSMVGYILGMFGGGYASYTCIHTYIHTYIINIYI